MVKPSQQNNYLSSGFYFTKILKPQHAATIMGHPATGTFINIKYVPIHNLYGNVKEFMLYGSLTFFIKYHHIKWKHVLLLL